MPARDWPGAKVNAASAAAARAAAVIAAGIGRALGHQPAAADAEHRIERQPFAARSPGVIPPVGQNRAMPKGAAMAFSAAIPPEASAGKNLKRVRPRSSPQHDVAGIGRAGQERNAAGHRRLAQRSGSAPARR